LARRRISPNDDPGWSLDGAAEAQLANYVAAWESGDVEGFVQMLKADATFSMPPIPAWYRGRETVRTLVARTIFGGDARGRWRLLPTRANGQPAFAIYRQTETPGVHRAYAVQVLTLSGASIGEVITFRSAALVAQFGFPPTISTEAS
jgi:RNA polymerase sigma-70 factor (ECF subfamily)